MLDHSRVSGRCPPVVDPSCLLGGLRPFRRDLRLTLTILLGEAAARDSWWWQVSDMMGASPDRPVTVRVIIVLCFVVQREGVLERRMEGKRQSLISTMISRD